MLFAKSNLSSNGIFIRPKFPREALRDNHDWRTSLRVRRIKKAAFDQPNLHRDRKSTRLNSSHSQISYAVFCLKKKKTERRRNVDGGEGDDELRDLELDALL